MGRAALWLFLLQAACGPAPGPAAAPPPARAWTLRVEAANADPRPCPLWLAWRGPDGEWEYDPALALAPGESGRAERPVPAGEARSVLLCDPHGLEIDDCVEAGPAAPGSVLALPLSSRDGSPLPAR